MAIDTSPYANFPILFLLNRKAIFRSQPEPIAQNRHVIQRYHNWRLPGCPGRTVSHGDNPTSFGKPEEPQREVVLHDSTSSLKPTRSIPNSLRKRKVIRPISMTIRFKPSDCPIVGVSWYDALAFLDWLNELTGNSYRLPTEAESARGYRWTHLSLGK